MDCDGYLFGFLSVLDRKASPFSPIFLSIPSTGWVPTAMYMRNLFSLPGHSSFNRFSFFKEYESTRFSPLEIWNWEREREASVTLC